MELDNLDRLAASAFDGFLVRKDLVRKYSRQYPVPTYVVEFLLGRYCATVDEEEIEEGLGIVERQLKDRTVRTGEEELFKAWAREKGSVKLIDLINAKLDSKNDCFIAELPSLGLSDVRINDQLVHDNERMLTDGFYAELNLAYDAAIAQEKSGRPFAIEGLRAIQLSKADVLSVLDRGRNQFTTDEWKRFLIRSVGLEPETLSERARMVALLRMVPFIENNFNMVELGLAVLLSLCGGLIERSVKGGLIIVGALNLGGSVEMVPNPVAVAELAVEKGAMALLMPISSRKQLFELSDEMATKVSIEFYADAVDAFTKAIMD